MFSSLLEAKANTVPVSWNLLSSGGVYYYLDNTQINGSEHFWQHARLNYFRKPCYHTENLHKHIFY